MMITRTDFLLRSHVDEATLDIWIVEEWLLPQQIAGDVQFTEADLARARLIQELERDLGINREGIGVILNLLDQLHSLRQALAGKLQQAR
jgi:chaperone modulatory protein CbpM